MSYHKTKVVIPPGITPRQSRRSKPETALFGVAIFTPKQQLQRGISLGMKIFFCALGLFFAAFSQARAHAVYVDAWVEEGLMCAEGSFAGKTKAKNSTVTVVDERGNTLREGTTDNEGKICFPLPEKPAKLTFILNAGQGHRAETKLHEEDFPVNTSSPAPLAQTPSASDPAPAPVSAPAPAAADHAAPGGTSDPASLAREAVRQEIRQELQRELGPIRQSLAALQKKEPGIPEIFGGIGWIVGLAGAAALAHARGRKK